MFEEIMLMIKDAITAASNWLTAVFTSSGSAFFAIFIAAFFIYSIYRLLLFPMLGAGFSDSAIVPTVKRNAREAANEKKWAERRSKSTEFYKARADYYKAKYSNKG